MALPAAGLGRHRAASPAAGAPLYFLCAGPAAAQNAKVTAEATRTAGTNQPATTSASRWIGARLPCAYSLDPGWRATVDGSAAPVMAADGVLLGVRVGPGQHRVVLRFVPPWLWESLALAALLATVLLVAGCQPRPGE